MSDKENTVLPDVVGDETIISLQKAVNDMKKAKKSGITGLFERRERAKGSLLFEIGDVPNAIYMLRSGTIRLKTVDGRSVKDMPVTTVYHASPDNGASRPLLGARYYFSRTPCTLAYVAETPCAVYEIGSAALNDLHDADRSAVIQMMYWLTICSDLSDVLIPRVGRHLGLEKASLGDTIGMVNAVEDFRSARNDARMPGLLYNLFKGLMSRRIDRAAELGLDPSIVRIAPRMDT